MTSVSPRLDYVLFRSAEQAWVQVLRPWLTGICGGLNRSYVIVPTRGQAQALKQRCLEERLPLLGVEFLTPGLARRKWMQVQSGTGDSPPAIGRELLLFGLRLLLARRLQALTPDDASWGFWKSLQSDAERALDDFDDLLKAGFRAKDFPLQPLQEVFGELTEWVADKGYVLAAVETERVALQPVDADAVRLAGRVLVYGLGPELWGEFFNVAAFVRRCGELVVALPEPEFTGAAEVEEGWVSLWRELLGVEPRSLDEPEVAESCEAVGLLWGPGAAGTAERVDVLVGRTRQDEMALVAARLRQLLEAGAEQIAVVFPRADAAHLSLTRQLREQGVVYVDLLESAAPPSLEVQAQRAILAFHEQGARLEDLLELWPWLRALGAATIPLAEARRACERAFDQRQVHPVRHYVADWATAAPELARVANLLLPEWPEQLTLAAALQRARAMYAAFTLEPPAGWQPLERLAGRETAALPRAEVLAALRSFLPDRQAARAAAGSSAFARVTLGTRRRLQGCAWSHLVLVESNAGQWPERREPSPWLPEEARQALNQRGRFSVGLLTGEQRGGLERSGYRILTLDTKSEVIFSAALFGEAEPEIRLAPNAWLERVLWARGSLGREADVERAFERLARSCSAEPVANPPGAGEWHAVWLDRRDPGRVFDEHFFAGDPERIRPAKLSPRLIERGLQDPAELWFEAVLRVRKVEWSAFARARRKLLGLRAHEVLAAALQSQGRPNEFAEMPELPKARVALRGALARLRDEYPRDTYWDSFHAELAQVAPALLERVYLLEAGPFVATEVWLPPGAVLRLGSFDLPVTGRMDVVRSDRPEWQGASLDIIDFKTGGDAELSAERMGRTGASLQLGVYLAAVLSVGARRGRVWMLKPDTEPAAPLEDGSLPIALQRLRWLEEAMQRGVYGALTRDASLYAPAGCAYPLACTPVPARVLQEKFERTFGLDAEEEGDE